jgi:hypothetical protein
MTTTSDDVKVNRQSAERPERPEGNGAAATYEAMSESEFLDAQSADAQAAVKQTWDDLKSTLKDTASLEVWARRHPWMVAGAAVAGGFLVATLLFSPSGPPVRETDREEPEQPSAPPQRRSSWLIDSLFGLLRPILGQILSSLVAAALGAVTTSMAERAGAPDTESQAADSNDGGPIPGEGPM